MIRPRKEGCPSDLRLDRMIAGDLAAAAAAAIREHVAGCSECAARLSAIEAARGAFAASPPPFLAAASGAATDGAAPLATPARTASGARAPALRAWWGPAGVALAAAAALALYFAPRGPSPDGDAGSSGELGTRIKGGGKIGLYTQRGGGAVEQAGPGEILRPGDTIQITYTSAAPVHLAVLSVDGARKASVYHPSGPRAAPMEPGRDAPLPQSIVLDDVLGAEVLYGLFCDAPIELEPVRRALEARPEAPPAVPGCTVDSLRIEKHAK